MIILNKLEPIWFLITDFLDLESLYISSLICKDINKFTKEKNYFYWKIMLNKYAQKKKISKSLKGKEIYEYFLNILFYKYGYCVICKDILKFKIILLTCSCYYPYKLHKFDYKCVTDMKIMKYNNSYETYDLYECPLCLHR